MGAENLTGNLPNKVQGQYQRPLPREFENANIGDVPWKDETGVYGWDRTPVLKAGIYTSLDSSVASPSDGDIYFGSGDSTATSSEWNASTVYDWSRYTADTSTWTSLTPNEGQLCYDTSANAWYTFDSTTTGWLEMQTVSGITSYTKKELEIGDWDMNADSIVDINHNLSATEWKTIRSPQCIIRNDLDAQYYDLSLLSDLSGNYQSGSVGAITSTYIRLGRLIGGLFDSPSYDSTGYNRGWVTFEYIKD